MRFSAENGARRAEDAERTRPEAVLLLWRQRYDYKGVVMVGLWCLLRKLGLKVEWWEHGSSKFWCLEFNEIVLRDLWRPLVPITEPPYPTITWRIVPCSRRYGGPFRKGEENKCKSIVSPTES